MYVYVCVVVGWGGLVLFPEAAAGGPAVGVRGPSLSRPWRVCESRKHRWAGLVTASMSGGAQQAKKEGVLKYEKARERFQQPETGGRSRNEDTIGKRRRARCGPAGPLQGGVLNHRPVRANARAFLVGRVTTEGKLMAS